MAETTIKDIARMCGCSVSTVSRALNNHPDINPETRKKIMQIVKETGFVPNNSAIQLKKSDTKAVALLVKGITNQFFNPDHGRLCPADGLFDDPAARRGGRR